MKKLPEYFAIKRKAKDPRWKQYIAYLNGRFNVSLDGTSQTYPYYGYGGYRDHMSMYESNPANFSNPVTVLTLDEFFDIINGSELPEKWCVEVTKENVKNLEDWRNQGPCSLSSGSRIYGYLSVNKVWSPTIPDGGYTEITTKQFERLVFTPEPKTLPTHWVIRPTNETEGAAVLKWFNANGERKYEPGGEQSYYWHFPAYEPTNHCLMSRIHNDNYTQITFAEFQEHVLKENPNKSQPMKNITVKKSELEQIHSVACSTWKSKIAELTLRNPFGELIELTQTEVNEMFAAATAGQTAVLVSVFGKPTNAVDLSNDEVDGLGMYRRNGHEDNTLIAVRSRGEYADKAFYLNSKFNWEIAKDREGLMCLVPTRK